MRQLIKILTLLTLLGCSKQSPKDNIDVLETDGPVLTNSTFQQKVLDQDSLHFLATVSKLENIQFFVTGQDSAIVTKDPTKLIELNTTKHAFYSSFDTTDAGLVQYMTVDIARKYHVKLIDGKVGVRPSANIIQLTFKDTIEASDWFNVYDNSTEKKVIQMKPKTELWLHGNHVYFVQTYNTPERDYLDVIKKTIIDNFEK